MVGGFKKVNNRAIAGFLLPFISMGIAGWLILHKKGDVSDFGFWFPLISIVPLILILGLYLSIRSISYIQEFGDKDYAYSGLVLNIFFLGMYMFGFIYLMFFLK